jgi:hypothetical protein
MNGDINTEGHQSQIKDLIAPPTLSTFVKLAAALLMANADTDTYTGKQGITNSEEQSDMGMGGCKGEGLQRHPSLWYPYARYR